MFGLSNAKGAFSVANECLPIKAPIAITSNPLFETNVYSSFNANPLLTFPNTVTRATGVLFPHIALR